MHLNMPRLVSTILLFCLLSAGCKAYAQYTDFNLGFLLNFYAYRSVGENDEFWKTTEKSWSHKATSEGIFVNRYISPHTYGNFEFRYIRKGSNKTINGSWAGLSLHYLETPISFGYRFESKYKYFLVEAGFAYACLIRSKVTSRDKNTNAFEVDSTDLSLIRNNEISIHCALKMPLNLNNKENLFLVLRISQSITSFHYTYKMYNLTYGIQLEYIIRGKGNSGR